MAGPGRYVPDEIEGIVRVEDLPKAKVSEWSRNYRHRTSPECKRSAYRMRTVICRLHNLGDPVSGRPREIQDTYSQRHCLGCGAFPLFFTGLNPPAVHPDDQQGRRVGRRHRSASRFVGLHFPSAFLDHNPTQGLRPTLDLLAVQIGPPILVERQRRLIEGMQPAFPRYPSRRPRRQRNFRR